MRFRSTTRFQAGEPAALLNGSPALLSAVGFSWLALELFAALAAAFGAWRLGIDPGWTNGFFWTDGILSHYQLWFAFAVVAQISALKLNRWAAMQPSSGSSASANLLVFVRKEK